jgi:hypothetical protein
MLSQTQKAIEIKPITGYYGEDQLQWKNWPTFPEGFGIMIPDG